MKPVAYDLCAGLGGGSAGLKEVGYHVVAFDIEAWPNPHADEFCQGDIRTMKGSDLIAKYGKPSFIWASPPCQEFSYRSFPFTKSRYMRDNVPPDKSIWLACERLAKECGCPIVIENVSGAQGHKYPHPEWYMGKAAAHYGSFYLWGDVPAILPIGNPRKGFSQVTHLAPDKNHQFQSAPSRKTQWQGNVQGKRGPAMSAQREIYKPIKEMSRGGSQHTGSHSKARKLWSAKAAMIPIELSRWIGQCFYPGES